MSTGDKTIGKHSMGAERIGIVGAGRFGLALAAMLGRAGRSTLLWSPNEELVTEIMEERKSANMPDLELPDSVRATADPKELAKGARFLVISSSSQEVRAQLAVLGNAVDGSHMAVHAIGAFCSPDDMRVSQVISQETPILRTGVLAGPSMADFIAAGRGTSLVCASEFDEVTAECRRLLGAPPILRLYRSRDLIGAELASALSMAYSISIGLADSLQVGIGIRAVLLTRAVSEMSRLGAASGAEAKTFSGLAGLGNLLVRTSVDGKHQAPCYRLGKGLASGGRGDPDEESVRATQAACRLARASGLRLPVLEMTARVLKGELGAKEAAGELLAVVAEAE